MTDDNAKEPAFPTLHTEPYHSPITGGLTKHEWLAGLAMQGLLANPARATVNSDWLVREAVPCADALLAALKEGKP
jgi:hypothetical protein